MIIQKSPGQRCSEKLEEAREVLDDVIATTSEVSEAAQELNDAVAALEDKVPPADKTELQQLYNEVKGYGVYISEYNLLRQIHRRAGRRGRYTGK